MPPAPRFLLPALVASCMGVPFTASAQSLRCKSEVVAVGDSRASVLQKCGEPVVKDSFCKTYPLQPGDPPPRPRPCETVDEWTYNPGYGQFMTMLRFEGGRVASIQYGERAK